MMRKTRNKRNKNKKKNDKIPRVRVRTLTTDRNMVQSDALPTEMRGTCRHLSGNFKVMHWLPLHCKDQA